MSMIDMGTLVHDILDAVSFSTALLGGGWLYILVGQKWGGRK